MREKVTIGNAELWLGDCREILPSLETCDLLLTDPPYGIGEDGKRSNRNRKADARWTAPTNKDYGANNWDAESVPHWLMMLALDICPKQIVWGGNYYDFGPTKGWLVWDKQTDGKNGSDCELAWTNFLSSNKRIVWLWDGFRQQQYEERQHPTQKPIAVISWAINLSGNVSSILDPFMGSGTTGVACANLGKRFIGIEREPKYFEIACKRIEHAVEQQKQRLFEPEHEPASKPEPQSLGLDDAV